MKKSSPASITDRRRLVVFNDATFAFAVYDQLFLAGIAADLEQELGESRRDWVLTSACKRKQIVKAMRAAGYSWNSRTKVARPSKPVMATVGVQFLVS